MGQSHALPSKEFFTLVCLHVIDWGNVMGETPSAKAEPAVAGRAFRIRHLALEVANLEKSTQFYQSVFGMKVLRIRENPIRNDVAAYLGYHDEQDDVSIELYQFRHKTPVLGESRGFHFALAVENIEAVHDRAIKAGGLSKTAPQNNRPNSINKFAFILDLDGHEIELTENAHGAQS